MYKKVVNAYETYNGGLENNGTPKPMLSTQTITIDMIDVSLVTGETNKKAAREFNSNQIYKDVIDAMISTIKKNINISEIDYISGGERRDWFFSNIIAYLLDKPHISIYKNLNAVVSDSKFQETKPLGKK